MIVRIDKIRECLSLTGALKPMVRAFVTEEADVKTLTDYPAGSEAVNISTDERWMCRPDGYWHKVGSNETIFPTNIFGVLWTVGESNKLTRTDGAAKFADPTPSVNGSAGFSPFDTLMPWAGMKVVEDEYAGSLVAVPKYYYRIVRDGDTLAVQISDGPAAGFAVSPAHMDRDGTGERDVVYIARYHCDTNCKSTSGAEPMGNMTRAQFRSALSGIYGQYGESGYSQQDFAMFWTIRFLMLVEFATWDFQSAVGYGCGNGVNAELSGSTDSMPYHTGTVSATRDTYAVGIQYRYIEDMWANVAEWIDGWRIEENADTGLFDVYTTTNISEFSDTTGGVKIGSLNPAIYGFITDWAVPEVEGYTWAMLPSAATEEVATGTEYCADSCLFAGPALCSGGGFDEQLPDFGPFFLVGGPADGADAACGARLQKIPLGGLGAAAPSGV